MTITYIATCSCGNESAKKELKALVKEMSVSANVETVNDKAKIKEWGVTEFPAFAVNEKVKIAGRIPTAEEMMVCIKEEMNS